MSDLWGVPGMFLELSFLGGLADCVKKNGVHVSLSCCRDGGGTLCAYVLRAQVELMAGVDLLYWCMVHEANMTFDICAPVRAPSLVLQQRLDKPANIRISDWAYPLSGEQRVYAALDACAGLALHSRLLEGSAHV